MFEYCKFYQFALVGLLVCPTLYASEKVGSFGPAHDVKLLDNRDLDPQAKDIGYMREQQIKSDKYIAIQHHGINTLSSLGVSGYGISTIVWDDTFEPDSYTNMVFPDDYVVPDEDDVKTKDISHGTLVAACATSRYPASHGLAYGATVYPCSYPSIIEELDRIESVINHCLKTGASKPRVINLSMEYRLGPYSLKLATARLTEILTKNDMLLVMSAGNRGKNICEDIGETDKGLVSFRSQLLDFPALLKHVILVGATDSETVSQASGYSNRAGNHKDHVVFAEGLRLYQSILLQKGMVSKSCEDKRPEGTSFAAPIATSVVGILFKYFPHLTSQSVKQIVLNSAAKLEGFDPDIFGRGGLDPLQAWISALEFSEVYCFKGKTEAEISELSDRLSKMIDDNPQIKLELKGGYFIKRHDDTVWDIRTSWGFAIRNSLTLVSEFATRNSRWLVAGSPQKLTQLISANPKLRILDFSDCAAPLDLNLFITLAEHKEILCLGLRGMNEFRSQAVAAPGLSSKQTIQLVLRFEKLKLLELPNLDLDVSVEIAGSIERGSQVFCRTLNWASPTLTTLTLTGIKGLDARGNEFVEAVKKMRQLESIDVLGTDLSNSDTVKLAKALENKTSLHTVKLTLPCIPTSGGFLWGLASSWMNTSSFGDLALNLGLTVSAPLFVLNIAQTELKDTHFTSAYQALAKIPNLRSLTLGFNNVINLRDWTKRKILELRTEKEPNLVTIEFAN